MSEILDLSIIIVSWNVENYLRKCLHSIFKNEKDLLFELIVIDNASYDNSVEMVRQEFPIVTVISNQDNRGFNPANNQGIKIAKGRNVLLLNPDTLILDNNLLKEMIRLLDENIEIGAVGPKILSADKKTVQLACARTNTNLWTVLSDRMIEKQIYNSSWFRKKYYHTNRYVATLSGSCMMFKKEIVKKIGLMDEQFFMFLDDVDYCKRIRDAGWKVYYMANLAIIHFGGESSAQNLERATIEIHRSLKRYFQKHFSMVVVLLLELIMCLKFSLRLLKLSVKCLSRGGRMDSLPKMRKILGLLVNVYIRD